MKSFNSPCGSAMFRYFSCFFTFILFSQILLSQTKFSDCISKNKTLKVLPGKIPIYYSEKCVDRALKMQPLLLKIIDTYGNDNPNWRRLRLAFVDSVNWNVPNLPYGFFGRYNNWIIVPGDLTVNSFLRIYLGSSKYSKTILKILESNSITTDSAINAFYSFTIAHEFGHYYNSKIKPAHYPETISCELLADYFAYDFLYKYDPQSLKVYFIIATTFTNEYIPDSRPFYGYWNGRQKVGRERYTWFHYMIMQMIDEFYNKSDFLESFSQTFKKKTLSYNTLPDSVIDRTIDSLTTGVYSKWKYKIENTSVK